MFVRLFKFFEMSWQTRAEVKKWMQGGKKRDGFSTESFTNPHLEVATATNSDGQSVTHVAVEPCYLLSAYFPNPDSNPIEQQDAGYAIDGALARKASAQGVSKLLIVVPESYPQGPDDHWVRIIEREVPLAVSAHVACTSNHAFVN